jgi:hypothetical protein
VAFSIPPESPAVGGSHSRCRWDGSESHPTRRRKGAPELWNRSGTTAPEPTSRTTRGNCHRKAIIRIHPCRVIAVTASKPIPGLVPVPATDPLQDKSWTGRGLSRFSATQDSAGSGGPPLPHPYLERRDKLLAPSVCLYPAKTKRRRRLFLHSPTPIRCSI